MADTKQELICPACKEKMEKIFISDANINVDICLNGCGGILFDNRELEKCDEAHENISEILEAIENKTFNKVNEDYDRKCPICGNIMLKIGAGSANVQIDNCPLCGAKFLDNGELQKIRVGDKTKFDSNIDITLGYLLDQNLTEAPLGLQESKYYKFRTHIGNLIKSFLNK